MTARSVRAGGLDTRILPATDDPLRTHVVTPTGTFAFQEWFVGRGHGTRSTRSGTRAPSAPGLHRVCSKLLEGAEAILLAPSNPYLSIGPILAVREIRGAVEARRVRCIAVSPLVGGRAVSGPLDRMLSRMAGGTTPSHLLGCYEGLVDALVVDESDAPADADVELVAARTVMADRSSTPTAPHTKNAGSLTAHPDDGYGT